MEDHERQDEQTEVGAAEDHGCHGEPGGEGFLGAAEFDGDDVATRKAEFLGAPAGESEHEAHQDDGECDEEDDFPEADGGPDSGDHAGGKG